MKSKLFILATWAVVFLIILSSSSTANVAIKSTSSQSTAIHVDPSIKISSIYLPLLKNSLQYIKDDVNKKIVKGIIDRLHYKAVVDSEDIGQILQESGITNRSVYCGLLNLSDGWGVGWGVISVPPFPLLLPPLYIGPAIIVGWGLSSCSYKINGKTLTNHKAEGLALLGIGFTKCASYHHGFVNVEIKGLFLLIIIPISD